ncbi:hypothetical protein J2Z65_003705 [Paenibacillus aceris]|uniref:Uncharacterized protein n=1 Tax=Paenibacillus aceris TaxID=869555 RepID=A0ABS4I0P7_9BACL|nr:hypothetical protein [Paenibacillus aceris]
MGASAGDKLHIRELQFAMYAKNGEAPIIRELQGLIPTK